MLWARFDSLLGLWTRLCLAGSIQAWLDRMPAGSRVRFTRRARLRGASTWNRLLL